MDRYRNFQQLCQSEQEGHDFVILVKAPPSPLVIMAPHGGGIEPGTVDVAHAVAGRDHGFYAFKGIKPAGNAAMHITSNRFDEPRALRMTRRAEWVLTIHGCQDSVPVVFVGGRDARRRTLIMEALRGAGFQAEESLRPGLRGINPNNICNRGLSSRGVQLELSDGLRQQMFDNLRRRTGRRKTIVFHRFVSAVRNCLAAMAPQPVLDPITVGWRIARNDTDRLKAFLVRAIVFMEEQAITFDDEIDVHEDEAVHVLGEVDGEPVATGRLRFNGGWARLERIAVRRAYRGRQLSHALVRFMLQEAKNRGYRRSRLHAQAHLVELYRSHGFAPRGNPFREAGIDHVLMTREERSPRWRSRKSKTDTGTGP